VLLLAALGLWAESNCQRWEVPPCNCHSGLVEVQVTVDGDSWEDIYTGPPESPFVTNLKAFGPDGSYPRGEVRTRCLPNGEPFNPSPWVYGVNTTGKERCSSGC
jgi:hypothetical protein